MYWFRKNDRSDTARELDQYWNSRWSLTFRRVDFRVCTDTFAWKVGLNFLAVWVTFVFKLEKMSKENEAFAREANPDSNSAPAGPTIHGPTYNTVTPEVPQCGVPPVTAAGNAYLAPSAYGSPAVFRQKSVIETYLLWLVLGLVGGHHFYLGVSLNASW